MWLGDFNALTREDYTQQEWDKIASERSKNFWEEPRTEVNNMAMIKSFDYSHES